MSKRKKYNPSKVSQANIQFHMNNIIESIVIAWVPPNKGVRAFTITGEPIRTYDVNIHKEIMKNKYLWSFTYMVVCKDSFGGSYVPYEYAEATGHIAYGNTSELLNELHDELLKKRNKQHVCCTAWISRPHQGELSEEVIDKILTKLGAWEFKPLGE